MHPCGGSGRRRSVSRSRARAAGPSMRGRCVGCGPPRSPRICAARTRRPAPAPIKRPALPRTARARFLTLRRLPLHRAAAAASARVANAGVATPVRACGGVDRQVVRRCSSTTRPTSRMAGMNSHSLAGRWRSTSMPVMVKPCSKPALSAGLLQCHRHHLHPRGRLHHRQARLRDALRARARVAERQEHDLAHVLAFERRALDPHAQARRAAHRPRAPRGVCRRHDLVARLASCRARSPAAAA